jgi:hypothetical protein
MGKNRMSRSDSTAEAMKKLEAEGRITGEIPKPRRSKYRNVRTNGYASKREARRAFELEFLQSDGKITELQEQVRFRIEINGILVCAYVADFVYYKDGKRVVEDCKGHRTREYKLKAKLMQAVHGIVILET